MGNFSDWWLGLNLSLKIYWAIAVPFTFFFVLQLVFSFFGGDVPDDSPDADSEIDSDGGMPFQFFTLKNLIAFFTLFGWAGIAAVDSGVSQAAALIIAFAAGLLTMFVMAGIAYLLSKATADGTLKFSHAVGRAGEVYLTIPSNRGSTGKIQITVQGALRTLDAVTDDEYDIPTGKIIKVKEVVGDNLLLVTAK
jgi:hypothetical protein